MKTKELRMLSETALRARVEELRAAISELRFGAVKEKNVKKLKAFRHERARVLTLLREHQQHAQGGTP